MKFEQIVKNVCAQLETGGWSKKDLRPLAKSQVVAELVGRMTEGYGFDEVDAYSLIVDCAISPPDEELVVIAHESASDGRLFYCWQGGGAMAWTNDPAQARRFADEPTAHKQIKGKSTGYAFAGKNLKVLPVSKMTEAKRDWQTDGV